GGTTKAGFDCSGYIGYVYKGKGVNLPRTAAGMYNSGKRVKKASLAVGDLVFFNTTGKGVSHVGMYIGGNKFIHASTSKGVRVDKLNDPYYWGNKYVGAKRVATVTVAKK
ncbi:MAG: C40 family peptidase, partial [Psychrobacillus psychrotolerans]